MKSHLGWWTILTSQVKKFVKQIIKQIEKSETIANWAQNMACFCSREWNLKITDNKDT